MNDGISALRAIASAARLHRACITQRYRFPALYGLSYRSIPRSGGRSVLGSAIGSVPCSASFGAKHSSDWRIF